MATVRTIGALAMAIASFGALPALADEVWSNATMNVVWAEELPDVSVFTYKDSAPRTAWFVEGRIVIAGLSGSDSDRGNFTGYWVEAGSGGVRCTAAIVDASGAMSWYWGTIDMSFAQPTAPSSWSAIVRPCFGTGGDFLLFSVDPGGG